MEPLFFLSGTVKEEEGKEGGGRKRIQ